MYNFNLTFNLLLFAVKNCNRRGWAGGGDLWKLDYNNDIRKN